MTIALLIWARLLLVTDWPRTAVCVSLPASVNATSVNTTTASWHAGGDA